MFFFSEMAIFKLGKFWTLSLILFLTPRQEPPAPADDRGPVPEAARRLDEDRRRRGPLLHPLQEGEREGCAGPSRAVPGVPGPRRARPLFPASGWLPSPFVASIEARPCVGRFPEATRRPTRSLRLRGRPGDSSHAGAYLRVGDS